MNYESAERDLRRARLADAQLHQPQLRQPRSDRQAVPQLRPRALGRHGRPVPGRSSTPTTGWRTSCPAEWMPARELPNEEYPFVLNTGRLLEHWHTGSMTRRSFALDAISPNATVFLHPEDAERMGIADGEFARVTLAARLDRARGARLAPRDAGQLLHPVPLPRGGRQPAHDRRDRPVREDPRVQVLRRPRRAGRGRRVAAEPADDDRQRPRARAGRRGPGGSPVRA